MYFFNRMNLYLTQKLQKMEIKTETLILVYHAMAAKNLLLDSATNVYNVLTMIYVEVVRLKGFILATT